MTSISVNEVGSSSMKLSWDGTSDGTKPVYTLDLMDSTQKELLRFKTDETSLSLKDLDPSTKYIFKLSKPMTGILPYISNIRIVHPSRTYLALNEILVFDINGRHMASSEFNLSSSRLHSSTRAPLSRSMDRRTYKTDNWTQSCMLSISSNTWWNGSLKTPTQLKSIEIHTTSNHRFYPTSSLVLTTPSGVVFTYGLGGNSRGDYKVSTHVKHQRIPMTPLPIGHIDTKEPPPSVDIKNIRFTHKHNSWVSFVELIILDKNGRKMRSSEFRITSSRTHNSGKINELMDGRGKPGSSWTFGAMLYKRSSGSWLNISFLKPTAISSIRIYGHSSYRFNSRYSKMVLTTTKNKTFSYVLGNKYKVNRALNHEYIPIKL